MVSGYTATNGVLKMRKEAIVFDVDQVLLDYTARLREWFNRLYGKHISGFPAEWDLTEWLEQDSTEDMLDILDEFSQSWEFGTLDALPGADVVLHQLVREGYALICLTACGDNEASRILRKVNLYHRFGDIFDEVYFVGFHDSKSHTLDNIQEKYDIVAFIDDKPENIIDAYYGSNIDNVILMKSPHNRAFRENNPRVLTAFTLYDCKQLINQFSQED